MTAAPRAMLCSLCVILSEAKNLYRDIASTGNKDPSLRSG